MRTSSGSLPSSDAEKQFEQFWKAWPTSGNKKLTKERFLEHDAADRERILAAAARYAKAVPRLFWKPRAEKFVGGDEEYWREWADGPPPRASNWWNESREEANRRAEWAKIEAENQADLRRHLTC